MTKILTKLLCAALLLLCAFNTRAQEIDSLYVDSTDNEFSTVHMLDSVFRNVDLEQVPPNSRAFTKRVCRLVGNAHFIRFHSFTQK